MKRAFLALIVLLIICNIYGGAALADGNQTAQQKADSIHILDADGNDLTIKSSTLTIHVGEMTSLQAVVDPTDTQDGTVEWTCSDSAGKTLRMINTANDTVIIACISTEYKNLRVTASSNGVSATITVNVKPAIEKKDEASDAFTQWSSTDMPFAVIYRYENEEWFLVTKEQMTIGRLGDIQINDFDRHISRIHALIFYEEGKFYLQDFASTNGTAHNGAWLDDKPVELSTIDSFQLADELFVFAYGLDAVNLIFGTNSEN